MNEYYLELACLPVGREFGDWRLSFCYEIGLAKKDES
jgi:hypothetical protein